MAKLHDLVTPAQLLEEIRNGALKGELIKKYRTAEQEMAVMLLPLYRSGELSKVEFNDFFKGVPLRKQQAPSTPEKETALPVKNNDEAPSQIFKALSDKLRPKPPKPRAVEEPEPVAAEGSGEKEVSPQTEVPEPAPAAVEQAAAAQAAALQPVPAPEVEEPPAPEPVHETPPPEPAGVEAQSTARPLEPSSILDKIFARLDSIDARLSEIEKKLSNYRKLR